MDKTQKKILNRLVDKYERSKSFSGENKVNQSFCEQIVKLFPLYADDSRYEEFNTVNESVRELAEAGLIRIAEKKNGVINRVILNQDKLTDIYQQLGRRSREADNQWLNECWRQLLKSGAAQELNRYIEEQKRRMKRNVSIEYYQGDHQEYLDILNLAQAVLNNEGELYIRDFSMQLFKRSKRAKVLQGKVQGLLYQYGEFEEKEFVFEECGIVETPTYVAVKGKGILHLQNQSIDLSILKGDIALSTVTLSEIRQIEVTGNRVVTIENMTSFHDYQAGEEFAIYLGGFHNRVKAEFLRMVYADNQEKEYRHFGDIDAGGFYILEHLKRKTAIPFRSLKMDCHTLIEHQSMWQPLTGSDRKRLEKLLDKFEQAGSGRIEDYRDVLRYMIEHDCKLEQEGVLELSYTSI